MSIRVLVVDDQALVRAGFGMIINAEPDLEVAGEAANGREAIDAVRELAPDIALMDVRMPLMDGLEATRRIRALPGPEHDIAVVAMTADAMPEDVARCLAAGMNAHMAKPINQAGLLTMVNRALSGDLPEARVTPKAEAA